MRKKDLYNKTMAAVLCITVAAGGVCPAFAAENPEKDENIYVSLNEDGSVSGVYVVNEYMLDEDTDIVDYGNYSEVKNLSSDEAITLDNGKISVKASKGRFYYQGILQDAVLPWDISISYTLDGKKISAKELAGKSGKLKITISVRDNKESNDEFFDNYLVQGSVSLNTEKCTNIEAEGASQANIGKNRQLIYNIMAGQEKTFHITADVTEFEMEAISFQAIPMSFDIDRSSIDKEGLYEKTDEIKDAAKEFDDGAKELDDGAKELADGVSTLKDGSSELKNGSSDLKEGAFDLKKGTQSVASGADSLSGGAKELNSGLSELESGISQLNGGISSVNSGAAALQSGIAELTEKSPELTEGSAQVLAALQQIQQSLAGISMATVQMQELTDASSQILAAIQALEQGTAQVGAGLDSTQASYGNIQALEGMNQEAAAQLSSLVNMARGIYGGLSDEQRAAVDAIAGMDIYGALDSVEGITAILQQNNAALEGLMSGIDQVDAGVNGENGLYAGMTALSGKYAEFDSTIQSLPALMEQMTQGIEPLKAGIDQLTTQYEKLNSGIIDYTNAVSEIQKGYGTLYSGIAQASSGTDALVSGAAELAKGNSELASGASSLASGASSLNSGANTLYSGTRDLYNGAKELDDGVAELQDGAAELGDGIRELKDGTEEFLEKTEDVDEQIDEEIDKMLEEISGSDFEQISFVSDRNKNVGLVQFAIQTQAIVIDEPEVAEPEAKQETFTDKLKNLFHKS